MKIRFNWGTGIFVVIVIFILGMAFLVYLCTTVEYSLVEKDYYPKGVDYQAQINKLENASPFSEQISVKLSFDSLIVAFPKSIASVIKEGSIFLYRPSDPFLDRRIKMNFDTSGIQVIKTNILRKGKYIVKMDWKDKNKPYYIEKSLIIP